MVVEMHTALYIVPLQHLINAYFCHLHTACGRAVTFMYTASRRRDDWAACSIGRIYDLGDIPLNTHFNHFTSLPKLLLPLKLSDLNELDTYYIRD
jgi:hypothetical protein